MPDMIINTMLIIVVSVVHSSSYTSSVTWNNQFMQGTLYLRNPSNIVYLSSRHSWLMLCVLDLLAARDIKDEIVYSYRE